MADKTVTTTSLEINSMPDGGFVVREAGLKEGMYRADLFASTTIDDALSYIKSKMEKKDDN